MKRILYLLAMYSGARAVFNVVRSFSFGTLRTAVLDKKDLMVDRYGLVSLRVHARKPPMQLGSGRTSGMVSIYLNSPGISRVQYALLRCTSHFGCGHVEIAFYETPESVVCYAIRDILQSNLDRLGWQHRFRKLPRFDTGHQVTLLESVLVELRQRGINATFALPEECVSLAVDPSLLRSKSSRRAIKALTRRYRRIADQLAIRAA